MQDALRQAKPKDEEDNLFIAKESSSCFSKSNSSTKEISLEK